MSADPLPTLKCVIAWSDRRNLCDTVARALRSVVDAADLRRIGDDAHLVLSTLPADEMRDLLRQQLDADEGLLVIDFEVWSGYGSALDSRWLLARGH
jgi:hypothetical protein